MDPRKTVRKQHIVSKFYLKAFADDSEKLLRTVVPDGRSHLIAASKASVVNDFYSLRDGQGNLDDYYERKFSEIEGPAAVVHKAIVQRGRWPLNEDEKYALGAWAALQFLRSEGMRNQGRDVYATIVQLMVSISGKNALKEHIEASEKQMISDQRLEFEWQDLTKVGGPQLKGESGDHLSQIAGLLEPATQLIVEKQWNLLVFKYKRIITCDHPISMLSDPDEPHQGGVGFGNAAGYCLPLSRQQVLLIGGDQETSHRRLRGTAAIANSVNQCTAANARSALYSHPEDVDVVEALTLPEQREWEISPLDTQGFLHNEDLLPKEDVDALNSAQRLPVMKGMGSSFRLSDIQWPIPGRLNPWIEN